MSKRAEEAAKKAYPDNDTLFFAEDRQGNWQPVTENGREINGFIKGYEQAEEDLAKAILAEYKKQWDLCPDADKDDDYTISETQQLGRFMMMEDLYEKFCEPVGLTLDDLEE